jgi:thiol:disulfide interchange protein
MSELLLVLLAYTLFILVMAIPYLVIAGIGLAFFVGIAATAAGLFGGRTARASWGVALVVVSVAAAMTIKHWATTAPTDASGSMHRFAYQSYQQMRAERLARQWLRDGTFTQPPKEQRPRDAERRQN